MMKWTRDPTLDIPTQFKFCGNTVEDLWNTCKRAVFKILEYLKSNNAIKDTRYRQNYCKILDLEKVSVPHHSSLQNPKELEIKISVVKKKKACFFDKLMFKSDQGLDSNLEVTVRGFLESSFQTTLENTKYSEHAGKYKFACRRLSENRKSTNSIPLQLKITPKEKHRILDPDFAIPTSTLSFNLWESLHASLIVMASERGLKIKVHREEWIFRSIDVLVRFIKNNVSAFDIFEANTIVNVLNGIKELEEFRYFNIDILLDESLYKAIDENDEEETSLTYIADVDEDKDVNDGFLDHLKDKWMKNFQETSSEEGIFLLNPQSRLSLSSNKISGS